MAKPPKRHVTATELGLESRDPSKQPTRGMVPLTRPDEFDPVLREYLSDGSINALRELESEKTPPPMDVREIETAAALDRAKNAEARAEAAIAYAKSIKLKTADLLGHVVRDAGAGMQVRPKLDELDKQLGEEVGQAEDRAVGAVRVLAKNYRTIKWLVGGVIGLVVPVVLWAANQIRDSAYNAGVAAGWKQSIEQRIERLERGDRRDRRGEP